MDVADLEIGDVVYLNGTVYTARDMAHIRIIEYLREGRKLPVNFNGAAIFHAGPVAIMENGKWKLVVIGPTTSCRMEPFSETLLGKLGVKIIIGKGGMGDRTSEALKKYCAVYLVSPPGCAVVQARFLQKVQRVYWLDLGMAEAIWALEAKNWGPLVVAIDSQGNDIFKKVREKSLKKLSELIYGECRGKNRWKETA
jgi:tartrate/fumarate subfamily iron-sulfur-dependent hydro-lyase beta chain